MRKILAQAIRARREELDFTQESFAFYAGLARTYYGRIERGAQNISFERLVWLAAHLETSVPELTKGLTSEVCLAFVENGDRVGD